jgi:translation initiation factor 1A
MGKKKLKQSKAGSTERRAGKLPKDNMQFAVIREFHGGSRFTAFCEDGKTRMVRIPGKLKRRMWCRVNDLILIKPWVVQSDIKSDLVYRYLPAERNWLYKRNMVPEDLVI